MNYLIYFGSDIILYYDILQKKKEKRKRKKGNVNSYFVDYSFLTFSLLIS